MRYEKGHKESTRQKILETASREFRRRGIGGIGVVDIMNEAGLTHGGFYSHFASKDELVSRALLETFPPEKDSAFRLENQSRPLEEIIRSYLSIRHRDHPEKGCPGAALVGEMGRQPGETRASFNKVLNDRIADLEAGLSPHLSPKNRRKKAFAIFSTLLGALQISRVVPDSETSEQILEAGIEAALKIGQT